MERRALLRGFALLAASLVSQRTTSAIAAPAPATLEGELENYPVCSQCNMDRRTYHRTRHLVLYSDGLIEGTCSIRCVAVSLMQRPYLPVRAFYAADFGSNADPRPLVDTDQATYIIGGDFPPVMSRRPKTAFADAREAQAQKEARGGDIASFVEALKEAYADMVDEMQARRRRPRQAG